jgi:hypothetical protein
LGFDLDVFYLQAPVPAQTTIGTGTLTGEFLGEPISVNASGVASIPSATLPMLGFAPEIRLRWPLMVDATFPHGRLQPYFTGGPACTPEDCPRLIPLGSARSSTSRLPSPARRQDPGTRGDHPERVTQPRTATHGLQATRASLRVPPRSSAKPCVAGSERRRPYGRPA